jgi:hypothetical protein
MSLLKVNNVTDLGTDPVVTNGVLVKGAFPAGTILQVVSATTTTATSTTSTSFQNTSSTVTITPSKTTSKILLIAQAESFVANNSADSSQATIFRGNVSGTQLEVLSRHYTGTSVFFIVPSMMIVLDSPSTISPVTYTVGLRSLSTSNTARYEARQNFIAMEVAG